MNKSFLKRRTHQDKSSYHEYQAVQATTNDNDGTKIPVYIISLNPDANGLPQTKFLFRDPYFIIEIPTLSSEGNKLPNDDPVTTNHIITVLEASKRKYPDSPIILARDDCIANTDSSGVARAAKTAIDNLDFDIFYLSKWNDKCHLYTDKRSHQGINGFTARTQHPCGLQAIILPPKGRDILLGHKPMRNGVVFKPGDNMAQNVTNEIGNGNIEAGCIGTNIIDFDIRLATNNIDFEKLNECQPIPDINTQGTSNQNSYIWVAFILIILLIILIAAIKMRG